MQSVLSIFGAFLTSLLIVYIAIPSIIKIAELKALYDEPGARKLHNTNIPTLGGLAIFAGFIFSILCWVDISTFPQLQFIIASIIIIFFIGIKDDIIAIDPLKKLGIQIIATVIIVHWGGIRLTSLYGIFGINDIPLWFSYFLSLFTILVITNSFNFIDGIDGLLGGIGIIITLTFAVLFNKLEDFNMVVISCALIGALIAFLVYNITPAKIFMGDTGSLLVGLVSAVMAIKFIEMNKITENSLPMVKSAPAIAIGILIIPLWDLLRVFVQRVIRRRSPFSADKNHVHHLLLKTGMNHLQATMMLILINIFFILIVFTLQEVGSLNLLLLILALAFGFTMLLHMLLKRSRA